MHPGGKKRFFYDGYLHWQLSHTRRSSSSSAATKTQEPKRYDGFLHAKLQKHHIDFQKRQQLFFVLVNALQPLIDNQSPISNSQKIVGKTIWGKWFVI